MHESIKDFYGPDAEYEEIDYSELIKKLEEGSTLETIKNSPEWRLFREVWRRIYETADKQLDSVDPANQTRVLEIQLTRKFYRDVLGTTILKIKEDAKAAFEQAQERGLLNKISSFLKKDI